MPIYEIECYETSFSYFRVEAKSAKAAEKKFWDNYHNLQPEPNRQWSENFEVSRVDIVVED